jgi:hypothetical protein
MVCCDVSIMQVSLLALDLPCVQIAVQQASMCQAVVKAERLALTLNMR